MKRLSVLVSSLFIFLGLFVSCKNDIKTEKKAYLTFGDVSRVIQPAKLSFAEDEEISFELKGKYEESEFSTLRTWSYNEENGTAYNQMIQSNIPVELGKWDFELLAIKNEQPFLKGSIVDKNIVIGENILNFGTMEILKEEGLTGSINFQLNFLFDEIKAVKCGLYDLNSNEEIEGFVSEPLNISLSEEGSRFVCYEKSEVPVGIYFMKFELYSDEKAENRIKVYSPVINVVAGHLTEGEDVLESINTFYTIQYELNGASWRNGYEPETNFNKNALVYLPSSDDLIYEGYNFLGWYIDDEEIESPYSYSETTSSVIILKAHWEENLSVIYSYELGRQNYASEGGASLVPDGNNLAGAVTKYKANVVDPTNSQTVWDYYVQPANVYFEEGCNYAVSVKLRSNKDTVVGIQAANADMFFTVGEGTDWTTCTFETGYIEKTPSEEKNGITIGFALAEEIYISSLKITPIEENDDKLPTLAFNVTKTGIENYLNNASRPENIIEVEKTELNDGYAITINTPLASNDYDSTNTYLYNDVTLELRDYAKNKGINKVAFEFQTSDTVYTSIVADTISPNSMAWNNKRQRNEELISTIFPVFEDGEAVTASIIKISNDDVTSQNETSFSIRKFKIEKIDAYSNKYFAIKTPDTTTGGDKYTESQSVPVSEEITIPGNNVSKEFDVLMYNKNDSGIDWDEVTRFIYSNDEKTIGSLRYYIGDDGKYYIQNTGSSEISCKITLTQDFTVQIEEVITGGNNQSGGTTGEGATRESPSAQTNGLAYFTKSDGNSGNISCLYIYNEEGLGLYRDLVNGTLKEELKFTKNSYPIGSFSTSYTGRVDAYLADDIEITDAWIPIGTSEHPFTSSFDGQGHSITFAENSSFSGDYAGVFGYAGNYYEPNSIVNLAVKGVLSSANAKYVGGIVACSNGIKVENCINMASLGSGTYVGGIIGYVNDNTKNEVSKCINAGEIIRASDGDHYRGGIVAHTAGDITISDCINLVELSSNGTGKGSGIVDVENTNSNPKATVNNCINVGFVNFHVKIAIANEGVTNCYYDSDKWTRVELNETNTYTPTDTSSIGKSTSALCALTKNELSDNWFCVSDESRYPLPDLSSVFTDNKIWEEICEVAKPVTEISSWTELVAAISESNDQPTVTFLITNDLTADSTIVSSVPAKILAGKNVTISRATEFTGAFFNATASLEIEGTEDAIITFDGKEIDSSAPLIITTADLSLSYCELKNNKNVDSSSVDYGGAICIKSNENDSNLYSTSFSNTSFYNNVAYSGGGIYCQSKNHSNKIKNCSFENNSVTTTTGTGAGIMIFYGRVNIDGITMSNNNFASAVEGNANNINSDIYIYNKSDNSLNLGGEVQIDSIWFYHSSTVPTLTISDDISLIEPQLPVEIIIKPLSSTSTLDKLIRLEEDATLSNVQLSCFSISRVESNQKVLYELNEDGSIQLKN